MKKVIQNIKNSFYNPSFYRNTLNKSFGESVQTLLLVSLFSTVAWFVALLPGILDVKDYLLDTVSQYPEDLVIEIKDGQVSINANEPFFIDLPETEVDESGEEFSRLVAIDTRPQVSIEDMENYDAYVLVTQNRIFYPEDRGIQSYDLSEVEDFVLDQEIINEYTEIFSPLIWPFIIFINLVASVVMGAGTFLLYMLTLIPLALVTKLIAWLKKAPLKYKDAYKLSMYAIIPAMIIDIVISLFVYEVHLFYVAVIFVITLLLNIPRNSQADLV